MLYFPWQQEFGAQDEMQNSDACFHLLSEIIISAPSRVALHNMPHPARMAQRRSHSNDVGRKKKKKKSTVSCGTSLSGQYEILLRWSPVGGRNIYIFVASASPRKSVVTIGRLALPWFRITRHTIIKMRYPLVLEGWHNCVQTQSLLHSHQDPNCLPFFSFFIIIFDRNCCKDTFSLLQKGMLDGKRCTWFSFRVFFFCRTNKKRERKLWVSAAAQSLRGLLFLLQRPLLYG